MTMYKSNYITLQKLRNHKQKKKDLINNKHVAIKPLPHHKPKKIRTNIKNKSNWECLADYESE